MRGFVFSVVFIIVFAALLSSIPAGLQGPDGNPDTVVPINPNLISGFAESEDYNRSAFSDIGAGIYEYEYDLGGRTWLCWTDEVSFYIAAKVLVGGVFWLGQNDICHFISDVDRGVSLSFDEITEDAEDGTIRYSLRFSENEESAGSFIVYWNTTAYPSVTDAWTADNTTLLHGMGLGSTATANIGALIVSLLFLQLPEVPVLINLFIAVPIWACIIYVLWYIVKEMIPFV